MDISRPPSVFHFDEPPHVMIVQTTFYPEIGDLLLAGARNVLERAGATHEVISVPGALEIPAAISFAIKALDYDPVRRRNEGFIALGCILKGGTHHDQIVAFESARALQTLSINHALAIGNGILTCNTPEQALERADPAHMNRGGAAAEACLHMIELKHKFRLLTKRRWVAKK